ncbi:MAG: FAD-dependent oxidoreductase [Oscillospiraceae bacterium]|nr:FAD-dependent oxidoreductase [Oscillospiraceae bacterium]
MFDAAIIGTGPAGLSAALTLRIHKKQMIWFGASPICEKVARAERVSNYPGLPDISGAELAAAFQRHADSMGLTVTAQVVSSIIPMGEHYAMSAGADFYEAKTVLLATGIAAAGTLPGEEALLGRGVSYCATCDGMLYRGRHIAVICTAKRLEHEIAYLAELAEQIDLFPLYRDCGISLPNVTLRSEKPQRVQGDERFTGLTLSSGETLAADGLFCLRTAVSLNTLLPGLETENGHIRVNRGQETSLRNVFAAGDCTGRPYQYVKAAGEGNAAAHSIIKALAQPQGMRAVQDNIR